jgi:hypothetical protein
MTTNPASWKQKVDPASVLAIKTFIGSIESGDEMTMRGESKEIARLLRERGIKSFERFYENKDDLKFAMQLVDVVKPYLSMDGISDLSSDVKKQKLLRSAIDPALFLWGSFKLMNEGWSNSIKNSLLLLLLLCYYCC